MTVTTTSDPTPMALPSGRYSFLDLVKSEWTKVRTVRSTMWTIGVTIVLGIGISALVCAVTRAHWDSTNLESRLSFDAPATSLVGMFLAQFSVGVLGVLVMTAEYSTGTIRATFSAAPKRSRVFSAKVFVYGLLAFVVAEVTSFVSFFLGQFLLSAPATHATLASPGAFRAVFGGGLYVCVLGLIAMGLGTIIRHTAGAISAFVGILLILPIIVQALPNQLSLDIRRFLPDRIGASIITTNGGLNSAFSPWVGLMVLCIYAVALLVIGNSLLQRRDA
ncbi:MAG: ABC transporter permease [Acidimicrobiales bacterium]|jgi:ABC-type transport system involved in multi-copper enzyme maturation permease subunit